MFGVGLTYEEADGPDFVDAQLGGEDGEVGEHGADSSLRWIATPEEAVNETRALRVHAIVSNSVWTF